MSKQVKTEVAPVVAETKETPKILSMKSGMTYRGARQSWYERMLALSGKTEAEVLKDLTDNRPSVYGAKSKFAGQPEPVPGWVRFFERSGVATWK